MPPACSRDCAALPRLRIAADCANGAMSRAAPEVLRQLGFDVVALNVEPDGRNINRDCGVYASGGSAAGPLSTTVAGSGWRSTGTATG